AAAAAESGLSSAFAVPILIRGEVFGVMEFFSRGSRPPDEDLLEMTAAIGHQIGQFIERKAAEAALSKNRETLERGEERYRTFIKQSSEGIWRCELVPPIATCKAEDEQIDEMYRSGCLGECNDAMARMYGFSSALEIEGARLGDLLPRSDP